MRLLCLFAALCYVAMAQRLPFRGVTIGGTPTQPTIINPAGNQPIIGYAVERITSNGVDTVFPVTPFDSLAKGAYAMPGTERPLSEHIRHITHSPIDQQTGQFRDEGDIVGYKLVSLLFLDGTYLGPSGRGSVADVFQYVYPLIRSFARSMQYQEGRYAALEQARGAYSKAADAIRAGKSQSVDWRSLDQTTGIASAILEVRDHLGEGEADKALARIAALPDITIGGLQ